MNNPATDLGFFSIFGIAKKNKDWINNRLTKTIGVSPSVTNYSGDQTLFYYTNYGDLCETGDSISIKIGFARSSSGTPLSSKDLLEQNLVSPENVQADRISGNYLVSTFSKKEPRFSVYQSLLALPQLFYTLWEGGILCSTSARVLVNVLQKVEINEKNIPMLFFFRCIPGPLTIYKDVSRIYSGEQLTWTDNQYSVKLLATMKYPQNGEMIRKIDKESVSALSGKLIEIMGSYMQDIKGRGVDHANLLSGGVDSSTIQFLVNRNMPAGERPLSFSYIWDDRSFQFEVDYARDTSRILNTLHIFYQISTQEYADDLVQAVEYMSQPAVGLVNSGKFILAKYIRSKFPSIQYLYDGQCADCLFGTAYSNSISLRYANIFHRMPGSYALAHFAMPMMDPAGNKSRLAEVMKSFSSKDTYSSLFIPRKFLSPGNRFGVDFFIDFHRRVFGDKALSDCYDYRNDLLHRYSSCSTPRERIQDTEMFNGGYESAVRNYTLLLAEHKEEINFFLDDDVIRLVKAFDPNIRYVRGDQVKPIIKDILSINSLDAIAKKVKGGSGLGRDSIFNMLKTGVLKDLTASIERPDFLSKREFDTLVNKTEVGHNVLLWDLLVFDIFQKQIKNQVNKGQ